MDSLETDQWFFTSVESSIWLNTVSSKHELQNPLATETLDEFIKLENSCKFEPLTAEEKLKLPVEYRLIWEGIEYEWNWFAK